MRIFLVVFLLVLGQSLFAQRGKRDVVYLKNGSIIRGTIQIMDPGRLVRLKTTDNNLWVFPYDQIDSIQLKTRPDRQALQLKPGYFNVTELGFLAGNYGNATRAPFTIMNVNSWYFAKGFSAGLGAGVELSRESYLPVVADFRYFIRAKRPHPFVCLQAGYSVSLGGSYTQTMSAIDDRRMSPVIYPGPIPSNNGDPLSASGGFLINPAVGIQTPLNENLSMTFSAGYRWMRHNYSGPDNYKIEIDYNRLSLKIGLFFK